MIGAPRRKLASSQTKNREGTHTESSGALGWRILTRAQPHDTGVLGRCGVAVGLRSIGYHRSYATPNPVSTEMADRVRGYTVSRM